MPDQNKFDKLREIGYSVAGACQLCTHSQFGRGASWGTCDLYKYHHAKHDSLPGGRGVSIHKLGCCQAYEADVVQVSLLGPHTEFYRPN